MATTTTTEKIWLDIMPAIPLARSVPVAHRDSRNAAHIVHALCGDLDGYVYLSSIRKPQPVIALRVDLGDPQGFGYAWRIVAAWLAKANAGDRHSLGETCGVPAGGWTAIRGRWWHNQTTDADRLALAHACAEVAS